MGTELRKLYQKATECDLDTELYGSKDLAALLRFHFAAERLEITEVPVEARREASQSKQKADEKADEVELSVEEKSWLFGKRKDHLEDANLAVSYKSDEKLREPKRIMEQRRERLTSELVMHEVKMFLHKHDECGDGVKERDITYFLKNKFPHLETDRVTGCM